MNHRNDIDGLRAVAVSAVLLFHFDLGGLTGGYTGVDIFFVISGFVIANSIADKSDGDAFSVTGFYFKRVRRIFPAYIATMTLTTAAACLILLPSDLLNYGKSLFAANAFFSNIYFWKTSGYFDVAAHTKPLLHTWSLSVEEQFYLFAPVLVHFLYRLNRRARSAILIPLILISFAGSVAAVFFAPSSGFFLLPTRAWELFIGVLLAVMNWRAPESRPVREALAAIGGLLIVSGCLFLTEDDPFPGWNALYPCIGTALLIYTGSRSRTHPLPAVNRMMGSRPFVLVGLISYSLYLVHWPIVTFARYILLRNPTPVESWMLLAISFVLAILMWRYIEQPFRQISRNSIRKVLVGGLSTALVGCAAGGMIVIADGLPGRHPDFRMRHISGGEDWGGEKCFNLNSTRPIPWDAEGCTRIHGSRGRILLWGDSYAAHYMPGILSNQKEIDADVLQYTSAGCPPILGDFSFARVGCSISNRRVLSLIRDHDIDVVIMSALWKNVSKSTLNLLPTTISELKKTGVSVIVLGQSPQFFADVQQMDYVSGGQNKSGMFASSDVVGKALNARLAILANQAEFVDPTVHLCASEACPYRQNSDFLFLDNGHLSRAGAIIAVSKYFPTGTASLKREMNLRAQTHNP